MQWHSKFRSPFSGQPTSPENTSEDMFIRTLMESPVAMPTPTMEMLGFIQLELLRIYIIKNRTSEGISPTNRLLSNRSIGKSAFMIYFLRIEKRWYILSF